MPCWSDSCVRRRHRANIGSSAPALLILVRRPGAGARTRSCPTSRVPPLALGPPRARGCGLVCTVQARADDPASGHRSWMSSPREWLARRTARDQGPQPTRTNGAGNRARTEATWAVAHPPTPSPRDKASAARTGRSFPARDPPLVTLSQARGVRPVDAMQRPARGGRHPARRPLRSDIVHCRWSAPPSADRLTLPSVCGWGPPIAWAAMRGRARPPRRWPVALRQSS